MDVIMAEDTQGESKQPDNSPLVALYWREIERYNRASSDWYKEAGDIENVYLDGARAENSTRRMYSMLWANVETLKPAVYAKMPILQCSRRYKDRDPVARVSAELMERASNCAFDLGGVNDVFKAVRDDRLIAGRGQAWARYEAVIEQYEVDGEIDGKGNPITAERLKSEKVAVDYVRWSDFGHNICGVWSDVWLVWRAVYKTQDEMKERFGAEKAASVSYSAKLPSYGASSGKDAAEDRCKVMEIWDKSRGIVSWMVEGSKSFLESGPPPTNFRKFFPCPPPWYATKTSKELIPVPDYRYYKDQAKEINDLTDKIGNMQQWLIVKGFVPGTSNELDAIEEALRDTENVELMQTIKSWKEWSEKGGANKLIDWLPIDHVAKALDLAIKLRAQLIQDVFQITGVSDILRGQGDPNETATAQTLKAQTGFSRLRNIKDAGAEFCMEVGQLCAEIIAEQFQPETIAEMTGFKYVPRPQGPAMPIMLGGPQAPNVTPMPGVDPRRMMGANGGPPMDDQDEGDRDLVFDDRHMELLRNDRMRNFRIDVETDSTVAADEQAEKAARTEFLGITGKYLGEMSRMPPELMPIASELLMFAVRGFRAGRSVEEALERGFKKIADGMKQKAAQPPPPDPKMITAQSNAETSKGKLLLQAKKDASDAQLETQRMQTDAAIEIRKQNIDAALQISQNQRDADAMAIERTAQSSGGSSTI
jgi:hypothetical protein